MMQWIREAEIPQCTKTLGKSLVKCFSSIIIILFHYYRVRVQIYIPASSMIEYKNSSCHFCRFLFTSHWFFYCVSKWSLKLICLFLLFTFLYLGSIKKQSEKWTLFVGTEQVLPLEQLCSGIRLYWEGKKNVVHNIFPAHNPVHILIFREIKKNQNILQRSVLGLNKDWERTLNWMWNRENDIHVWIFGSS